MPEFIQEDQMPFKTVYVHFKNKEDMKAFEKLIDQRIEMKTKTIWYPEIKMKKRVHIQYVDEIK